jgi:hypothetical protein
MPSCEIEKKIVINDDGIFIIYCIIFSIFMKYVWLSIIKKQQILVAQLPQF